MRVVIVLDVVRPEPGDLQRMVEASGIVGWDPVNGHKCLCGVAYPEGAMPAPTGEVSRDDMEVASRFLDSAAVR